MMSYHLLKNTVFLFLSLSIISLTALHAGFNTKKAWEFRDEMAWGEEDTEGLLSPLTPDDPLRSTHREFEPLGTPVGHDEQDIPLVTVYLKPEEISHLFPPRIPTKSMCHACYGPMHIKTINQTALPHIPPDLTLLPAFQTTGQKKRITGFRLHALRCNQTCLNLHPTCGNCLEKWILHNGHHSCPSCREEIIFLPLINIKKRPPKTVMLEALKKRRRVIQHTINEQLATDRTTHEE
jgi:hypothetical protein